MYNFRVVASFDSTLVFGQVMHHFSDGRTILTHSVNKSPVIAPRDFVDLISYTKREDGSYVLVDVGVPNAIQRCEGCVRGAVVTFGYLFKPVAPGPTELTARTHWTEVTLLNQVLVSGWVAPFLVNRLILPVLFDYLVKYEQKTQEACENGQMSKLKEMVFSEVATEG